MRRGRPSPHVGGWRREWGLLCVVAVLALPLFTPRLYGADEIKYFSHLRSAWFDHDLQYANEYAHFLEVDPVAHAGFRPYLEGETVTGHRLNDAPIGAPLLWAPFYVAADLGVAAARALGVQVQRDGYGRPYVWAVCVASLFWGMLGLLLTYRICREYGDPEPSKTALLGMWFGSPLVFYLYITPPMAHATSLFAVALFLFVWLKTRDDRRLPEWVLLGVAAGLMVMVRELNWLFLLVLAMDEAEALWNAWRSRALYRQSWWRRYGLQGRVPGYLSFALALAVVVSPQFVVYRTLHGSFSPAPFVVDKFQWLPVHAGEVLFSGFHGLFSWTPVTLLGVVGLLALARRDRGVALALALVFAVQVAVVGSYDTWWGGASFGARRFINCVPLFALGLAAAVDRMRPPGRRMTAVAVAVLVLWNFGLAVQYGTGMIPRDEPVSMRTIAYNQVGEVPGRILGIGWRFLTDRSSFYETRS